MIGKIPYDEIKRYYKQSMPQMLDEYKRTGKMDFDPYELDLTSYATPIESQTWIAIRSYGLPFFPQFPELNYFLDFANPFLKIAIECDGKKWHDADRDAKRDARLMADGWMIYRIPGWQCNKVMAEPWDAFQQARQDESPLEYEDRLKYCRDWFCNTSDGVVMAIGMRYFGKKLDGEEYAIACVETLSMHQSAGATRGME